MLSWGSFCTPIRGHLWKPIDSWFEELTAERPEPLSEYEARERVAALGLFLFEIAGDLEQMQKSLGAILEENA
jgi:hypothetical protein